MDYSTLPGSVIWGSAIFYLLVNPLWPWNFKGKRRAITIKGRKKPWQ